jgi:3-deoxy-D-manno-octulosonate 8-phosphate phosphatase (KDO 8-P phosphatase)
VSHPPLPPGAEAIELLILDADGVLTDGSIWIDDQGRQMRRYSIRDGLAIGAWTRLGLKVAIVSGRRGADLDERARALGVDEVIQGVEDKARAVRDLLGRLGVEASRAAFLGDDIQDTPGMAEVGLPMAVADAEGPCLAAAAWVTRRPGGSGAVRDAIEALIEARGLTERAMMLMSRPRASGRISAGLLVAIVMAVVFAGVIGFFVLRGGGDGEGRRGAIFNTAPPVGQEDDIVGSVRQAEIPIADRDHPDQIAARVLFEESRPAGQPRTYDMVSPQAFIYLDNGQTLHVQGESGRFIMASRNSPPERGTIRGDVIVRLFDAVEGKAEGEELDIETATPAMTARTEALHFDTNRGQLINDERIIVESPRYEFAASGVSALFDRASRRLLKLEFAGGERLTYFPPPQDGAGEAEVAEGPAPAAQPRDQRSQEGRRTPGPGQPRAAAAEPEETLYHVVFRDDVVLSQSGRQLTADQLDVWARLVDNKMPDGAIGTKNLPEASGGLSMDPLTAAVAGAMAQAGTGGGAGAGAPAAGAEAPITLTWTGPLSVLPIVGRAPQELAEGNHLAMQFTASRTGQVRFGDEELGATGFCQALAYRATDQILTLWGIGERSGASLRAPGMGEIRGGRIVVNVATLMATIPGSGMLISLGEGDDEPAGGAPGGEITWGERAEFVFRGRPEEHEPEAIAIESALFRGNVEADTPDGVIHGEVVRAQFDPPGGADDRPRLRHLSARREAHSSTQILARSEREGEIRCDEFDVWFSAEGGGRRPRAERVLAVGQVEASGRDSHLTAGRLDATLVADERGRAKVERAEMSGSVVLTGRDADDLPLRARGEEITAWPERQRAILVGDVGTPAHVVRDGTSIEAAQIELDGTAGFVNAFGAGELRHALRHAERDRRGTLVATWTQQLELDDESGEASLHGDVVATVTRPMEEDRIAAEVVRIGFTPRDEVSASVKAAAASGVSLGDVEGEESTREFLSATAIGAVVAGETEALATIRSGRWIEDGAAEGGRRLVSLLSLEGPRIDVDAVEGELDVPGAGRLLMLDHRDRGEGGAEPDAPAPRAVNPLDPAGAAHGATLINWQGSMRMERSSGRLDIERAVRLSHKPSPDEPQMNLDCERLGAMIRETAPGRGAADQFQGELISALALGAVWVESGGRELVAERLTYDAITRDLEATAPGSAVIVHDGDRAATATARRVLWNLATDRIRIEEPGSVTAPAPER